MEHSVDTRQRTDNIWNLSIYVDDNIYTENSIKNLTFYKVKNELQKFILKYDF